jgi:hypothetical protein
MVAARQNGHSNIADLPMNPGGAHPAVSSLAVCCGRAAGFRLWLAGCWVLLLALLAACGGGSSGGSSDPPAPSVEIVSAGYVPTGTGDRWIYDVRGATAGVPAQTEVAQVEGPVQAGGRQAVRVSRREVSTAAPFQNAYLALDAEGVWVLPSPEADSGTPAIEAYLLLPARARMGQARQVLNTRVRSPIDFDADQRPDELGVQIQVTVVALETLNTAAGSFTDALKVETLITQTALYSSGLRPVSVTTTVTEWYGQGVGLLRSVSLTEGNGVRISETRELLGFRVAGRASERVAPTVTLERPTSVTGPGVTVVLQASEALDISTLRPELLELVGPAGQVVDGDWAASPARLQFVPYQSFGRLPSGAYRLNLRTGGTDLVGNGLAAASWDFQVDADGPQIVAWSAADRSDAIPVDTPAFTIDFSEDIAPGSVTTWLIADGAGYLDTDVTVEARRITVRPRQPLPGRTPHRLQVTASDRFGNYLGQTAELRFRTDPGRFSYSVPWSLPSATEALALGDVTGDGRTDVVATTSFSNTGDEYRLVVLAQGSDGQPATLPLVLPTRGNLGCIPRTVALGDLNADGRLDVAVGLGDCGLELFLQNAQGLLEPGLPLVGTDAGKIRIADMDGDGRDDIVGVGWGSGTVTIWRQQPGGGFVASGYRLDHGGGEDLALGDINGDGRLDVIVSSTLAPHGLGVLRQLPGGGFGNVSYYGAPGRPGARAVAVGDLDGDGRADIAYAELTGSRVASLRQTAQGQLVDFTDWQLSYPGTALEIADVDADGRQDLVAASDAGFNVIRQKPGGDFHAIEFFGAVLSLGTNPQGLAVGDINSDGLVDLVGGRPVAVFGRTVAPGAAGAAGVVGIGALAARAPHARASAPAAAARTRALLLLRVPESGRAGVR